MGKINWNSFAWLFKEENKNKQTASEKEKIDQKEFEQKSVSYGELALLGEAFEKIAKKYKITDKEIFDQTQFEYIQIYIDSPEFASVEEYIKAMEKVAQTKLGL